MKILMSDMTVTVLKYCLNQKPYLRSFLGDSKVPMDNNSTYGRNDPSHHDRSKNWMIIDTISGAKACDVIYSLVETAKANSLNIYRYFEHLLTELPKLKEFNSDEEETQALNCLLPWSEELPDICIKKGR